MLKALTVVLPIIVIVLAGYALMSGNDIIMSYMMLLVSVMLLVMGIDEIKKERKQIGIFSIIISVVVFFVSVQDILFN